MWVTFSRNAERVTLLGIAVVSRAEQIVALLHESPPPLFTPLRPSSTHPCLWLVVLVLWVSCSPLPKPRPPDHLVLRNHVDHHDAGANVIGELLSSLEKSRSRYERGVTNVDGAFRVYQCRLIHSSGAMDLLLQEDTLPSMFSRRWQRQHGTSPSGQSTTQLSPALSCDLT